MLDAYFAGLIDGEGTMGVYAVGNGKDGNTYWSPKFALHGTHRPMLVAAFEHFGVGRFGEGKRNPGHHLGGKPQWVWSVSSKGKIASVLECVVPFLIEKREQALTMLDYCNGEIDGEHASLLLREQKRVEFPHSLGGSAYLKRGTPSEACPTSRTTWAVAEEIRRRVADGEKQADLCREYGFSRTLVSRIVLRKTYINEPWKAKK